MVLIGIFSITAIGLDLLLGYGGQISLGHGAFLGIGAYISGILCTRYDIHPIVAMIAAAILTAGIAFAVGLPILSQLTAFHLAIATLAFGTLIFTIFVVAGDWTMGWSGLANIPPFSIAGFQFDTTFKNYYLVWGVLFVALLIGLNIANSQTGRIFKAIQSDEVAASALGVNLVSYKVKVFVVSAIYAAVAGSLMAHYLSCITPGMFRIGTSFDLVTIIFLGGRASIVGPIFGAAILRLLPEFIQFASDYRLLINGVILLLILMFAPDGLFGLARYALGRFQSSKRKAIDAT